MVDREIRGDAPRPGAEGGTWIEATARAVNPPERLDREVFCRGGVANDANNPAIHLCLKLPEQCLKGFGVAPPEALQQFHEAFLLGLTGAFAICYRSRPAGADDVCARKAACNPITVASSCGPRDDCDAAAACALGA
jgi:hypothetical protein